MHVHTYVQAKSLCANVQLILILSVSRNEIVTTFREIYYKEKIRDTLFCSYYMWFVKKYFGSRKLSLVGRHLYLHLPLTQRVKARDANSLSCASREARTSGTSLKAARKSREKIRETCTMFSRMRRLRRNFSTVPPMTFFNVHCPLQACLFHSF